MTRTLKAKDIERLENTSVAALAADYASLSIIDCDKQSICVVSSAAYGLLASLT